MKLGLLLLTVWISLSALAFAPAWSAWDNDGDAEVRAFAATRPVFAELMGEVNASAVDAGDGFLTYDLETIARDPAVTNRPGFFINLRPRTYYNAHEFYFGKFRHDAEAYRSWRERHPEFRGFLTLEWVNDCLAPIDRPKGLKNPRRRGPLSDNELEDVRTRIRPPKDRAEFVNCHLKNHFDRIVQYSFDDPKSVLIGDGATCAAHLAARWGAGALAFESTRDHLFYQIQMMFCRGAARQFRLPWMWYVATYIDGSRDGKYVSNCLLAEELPTWKDSGPNFGISLSAVKRTTYLSYLSGADYYEREATPSSHFLRGTPPVRLSEEGKMFEEFVAFTKRTDRGEPYQPFALLVPADRGYTRFGGRAFHRFAYTHADYMLDAVMATILECARNNDPADLASHQERVMANSRYGDLYDAITPDFEDDPTFAPALARYRAAFLFGETEGKAQMVRTLLDWVKTGGTLVLSAAQASGELVSAIKGADVLRRDATGNPVFLSKGWGAGRLIVGTRPYLTDWPEDVAGQEACLKSVGYHGTARFPELEWLVGSLTAELTPIKVSGDVVQYGFNRTKDGWLVYLINNAGVTKVWDKFPEFDPKPARVELQFGEAHRTVDVPSGEIVTVKFSIHP